MPHKLVFETKGPDIVLCKDKPVSYWLNNFPFLLGSGYTRNKSEGISGKYIKQIPPIMVIYNHVDGAATIFSTMSVTFMINPMENDLN